MTIDSLPPEPLSMIFENLDQLNDKGFRLSSMISMHPMLPASPARGWAISDLDTSIFNVMKVNSLWRAHALNVVFGDNIEKWSEERRNIKLNRFRALRIWLCGY